MYIYVCECVCLYMCVYIYVCVYIYIYMCNKIKGRWKIRRINKKFISRPAIFKVWGSKMS